MAALSLVFLLAFLKTWQNCSATLASNRDTATRGRQPEPTPLIAAHFLHAHRSITETLAEIADIDSRNMLAFMLMTSLLDVGEAFLEAQHEYILCLSWAGQQGDDK